MFNILRKKVDYLNRRYYGCLWQPVSNGMNPCRKNLQLQQGNYALALSIFVSALIIALAWVYSAGLKASKDTASISSSAGDLNRPNFEEQVLLADGIVLPVKWKNLGQELVASGVIDLPKFETLYNEQSGLRDEQKMFLTTDSDLPIKITSGNAGFLLNLFWALGLSNKNSVLETGPMADPRYNTANFASTGGWTLASGQAMNHYSRHQFVVLSDEQQKLVEQVAKNIYRPCCDNPTYFPDCNHGMAMLGLLELMASQGVSREEMYRAALQVNAYWFPENYLTIARYFAERGVSWADVKPKEILGMNYSSASGYQKILLQAAPPEKRNQGGCGV